MKKKEDLMSLLKLELAKVAKMSFYNYFTNIFNKTPKPQGIDELDKCLALFNNDETESFIKLSNHINRDHVNYRYLEYLATPAILEITDDDGNTLLMNYLKREHIDIECLKLLITENGLEMFNEKGESPILIYLKRKSVDTDCIKLLLSANIKELVYKNPLKYSPIIKMV